jgi:type 1 glutamine amidotransferase
MPFIARLARTVAATVAVLSTAAAGCARPTSPADPVPSSSALPVVLVVTHTTGFRHSSIETAEATLDELARTSGRFSVAHCRNAPDVARMLTADALAQVGAVFFANTTGDLGLPDLDGFFRWLQSGGGFLGAHSASDTYHGEPRYIDMLGAEFRTHGDQAIADIVVENRSHPATSGLGNRLSVFDEIYHFTANNRGRVDMLLSLDHAPADGLPGAGQPGDMPIAWSKSFGSGRVFYTALGHREDVWLDARFRAHLLGAITWVLRQAG